MYNIHVCIYIYTCTCMYMDYINKHSQGIILDFFYYGGEGIDHAKHTAPDGV